MSRSINLTEEEIDLLIKLLKTKRLSIELDVFGKDLDHTYSVISDEESKLLRSGWFMISDLINKFSSEK